LSPQRGALLFGKPSNVSIARITKAHEANGLLCKVRIVLSAPHWVTSKHPESVWECQLYEIVSVASPYVGGIVASPLLVVNCRMRPLHHLQQTVCSLVVYCRNPVVGMVQCFVTSSGGCIPSIEHACHVSAEGVSTYDVVHMSRGNARIDDWIGSLDGKRNAIDGEGSACPYNNGNKQTNHTTEENKRRIQENRRKIFDLENEVLRNRQLAYLSRAFIQENQASISRNYYAAFLGNRQLANQNTDDIFRNRYGIVRNIPADGPVQTNFKEALQNKAKLEFLDHRSKLNSKVLHVAEELSAANSRLIELNREIMDTNEEVVQYNAVLIAENTRFLAEDSRKHLEATPDSNASLIASNSAKIDDVKKRADENLKKQHDILEKAKHNRARIIGNSDAIYARRARIEENHEKIASNQKKVSEFISKL